MVNITLSANSPWPAYIMHISSGATPTQTRNLPWKGYQVRIRSKGLSLRVQMIPYHLTFGMTRIADAWNRKHPLCYRFCHYAFIFTLVPKAKLNISSTLSGLTPNFGEIQY